MLASLTLLPAMFGFFGPKILRRSERQAIGLKDQHLQAFWPRWASRVEVLAVPAGLAALGVIIVLAIPFFSLRQGLPDASTDPASFTTYQVYQLLAKGFGPGYSGTSRTSSPRRCPSS
jgi:RND superfamily putative drug exporter